MSDTMPLWFWLPLTIAAAVGYVVVEFRASARYWAAQDAADPVVVTGSGRPSNRYVRACSYEEVR